MRRLSWPGLVYAAFVLAVAAQGWIKPSWNWDGLAYVACALSPREPDPAKLHARAYAAFREAAPPEAYHSLVAAIPYREDMARDPELFARQLYWYKVKPLYVAGVRLLAAMGVQLARAPVAVSLISFVLTAGLLRRWLLLRLPEPSASLSAALLVVGSGLTQASQLSTPDAFSCALLLGGSYLVLERAAPRLGAALLCASVLARPDNVLFAAPALALCAPSADAALRPGRTLGGALLGLCLAATAADLVFLGGYGSSAFLRPVQAFLPIITGPKGASGSEVGYLFLARRLAAQLVWSQEGVRLALLSMLGAAALSRGGDRWRGWAAVAGASIALHVLIFPALELRYFLAQSCLIALAFFFANAPKPDPGENASRCP